MVNTILFTSMVSMFYFTGNVPRPFADAAFDKFETQKLVQAADKKYISNEIRVFGGHILLVMNVVYEQKVLYRMEF